jgi:hypothetical protein
MQGGLTLDRQKRKKGLITADAKKRLPEIFLL